MDDPTPRRDTTTLSTVALCLVIVAASWFLLQQPAPLLRPPQCTGEADVPELTEVPGEVTDPFPAVNGSGRLAGTGGDRR